jgi:hypothetical protein
MDKSMVETIARRAGLERALAAFPDDVVAAAGSAAKASDRIRQSGSALSEASESWPPMLVVRA